MSKHSENYEFNDKQNHLFKLLYTRMQFVGITFVLIGMVNAILLALVAAEMLEFTLRFHVLSIIFSVFMIVTGILLVRASHSFKKIIQTQGNDIDLLMNAVRDVYLSFDIQMWLILISVFFVVIMAVFSRDFMDFLTR